ncbi:MAG: hypothetical protein H0W76_25165 [Pyrinomonadaceae bacterium]|nr:hypothetical protein [Pyrinomonadaceae bacterium]
MAKNERLKEGARGGGQRPKLVLTGFDAEDVRKETGGAQPPELAVYAVDANYKSTFVSKVNAEGNFDVPDKVLDAADQFFVGPFTENFETLDRRSVAKFRASHFRELLSTDALIEIPRRDWGIWFGFRRCVSGTVRHCFPYLWRIKQLSLRAANFDLLTTQSAAQSTPQSPDMTSTAASFQRIGGSGIEARRDIKSFFPDLKPLFPYRCAKVCDGLIEVYRRTCCCPFWIIEDPRLPDLIAELEDILIDVPPIRFPPRPEPDPPPFQPVPFIKDGALDTKALNARRDLQAIERLSKVEQAAYILARPYLWCHCGAATKVAQGFIRPDGSFHICWRDRLLPILGRRCHYEYAYVIKQSINGTTYTIYNGIAANQWFEQGEDAELTSYSFFARSCRDDEIPGTGAFVVLQDIGNTRSYELKTPNADGAYSVATPVNYNDGLCFPAANPAAAKGVMKDCNWGGTLALRYHFSEPLQNAGGKYYRISVSRADANGNPTGPRTYLTDGLSWKKWTSDGMGGIVDQDVPLGPNPVGTQTNLFLIPYDIGIVGEWQSGQYHGYLDTTLAAFTDGRYLLTVEIFDAAGNQLRPTGTPDSGATTEAAFTFRRWTAENVPTLNVPFAALTHMLWWDNRPSLAKIVDLRKNGVASTEQCQFFTGAGGATFGIGYRAYHPNDMFHYYHSLVWQRGLGGSTGSLANATADPGSHSNVGQPPAGPGASGTNTFAAMLGTNAMGMPNTRCSFSINLNMYVKTWNGSGRLNGLDDYDQAAFALEQT